MGRRATASTARRSRAARRRRTRMAGVEHDLTATQWQTLQELWGGCAYCGAPAPPFQKDCVLPISRGGRYTLENVVPACGSCNASKCNDEVTAWMRRKRLDERTFLVRHGELLLQLRTIAGQEPGSAVELDPGTDALAGRVDDQPA